MQNRRRVEFAGIPTPGVGRELGTPGALYAVDFWRSEEKIRPERLPPAAADCAVSVRLMETRSRNEDDKLSTEPGQLHYGSSLYESPEKRRPIFRHVEAGRQRRKPDRVQVDRGYRAQPHLDTLAASVPSLMRAPC